MGDQRCPDCGSLLPVDVNGRQPCCLRKESDCAMAAHTRAELDRLRAKVERMERAVRAIADLEIIPPMMTEQARQLMRVQDIARAALAPPADRPSE